MTVYIKRNTLQTRLTHGCVAISVILLTLSGLFMFVPALAAMVSADFIIFLRNAHRVIGLVLIAVIVLSSLASPKGLGHFLKNYFSKWDDDDKVFAKRFVPYMLSPKNVDMPYQHEVKSGQRVVGWLLFIMGFCIILSGVVMFLGTTVTAFDASTMLIMRLLHDISFIVLIVLLLAHIYLGAGVFQPYKGMRKTMFGDGMLNESDALYHWGHWAREELESGKNVVVVDDGVEPKKAQEA